MTSLLQQASYALSQNDADTLEQLCAEAPSWSPTQASLSEYTGMLAVLRRQVLAAHTNIVLRQRLLAQHLELPWAP